MNELITRIEQIAGTGSAFIGNMTSLIITIVIGVLIGFFGLKLARVWAAFVGFLLGTAVGIGIVHVAGLAGMASVGVILGSALVFAVLTCVFLKVGIFFFIILAVSGLCTSAVHARSLPVLILSLLLGIVVAGISLKMFDPLVIIVTSISGGTAIASSVLAITGMDSNTAAAIAVPLVLTLVCAAVQFVMRSRQLGRSQVEKADEKRQEISRENEVEQARSLLEDDFPNGGKPEPDSELEDDGDDDFRIIE